MFAVAKPMIWLYLRTGSPWASGATATLCPRGTLARTVSSPADSPSCRSRVATRTLSASCRRTPKLSTDGAMVMVGVPRLAGGRRSSVPGLQAAFGVEAHRRGLAGDLQPGPPPDPRTGGLGGRGGRADPGAV